MKKIVRAAALFLSAVMLWACVLMPARAEKSSGIVRVLLTKVSVTNQLEIALDGSYTLDGIAFQRGSHLLVSSESGSLMVYYEGMALEKGKSLVLTRHQTEAGKENGVRLNGAYVLHPGDLYVYLKNGDMQLVLHAPVEEYLLGVVPYEMSDSFPLEALKAQAIAARTYALKRAGGSALYDVEDNTNDQAYYGVKAEYTNAAKAVKETAGICGFAGDQLADCYYTASNGGQTELPQHVWGGGAISYLRMADDHYDVENPESVVKKATLKKTLNGNEDLGALREPILSYLSEWMESKGYDGEEEAIRVTGIQSAEVALPLYYDSPTKIMTLLRLTLTVQGRRLSPWPDEEEVSIFSFYTPSPEASPSPAPTDPPSEKWGPMETVPDTALVTLDLFPLVESALGLSINGGSNEIITVRETDSAFILESRRYGHGVGMSQRGAQWMAGHYNWNHEQILRFYYPGMALKTLSYTYSLPAPLSAAFLSTPGPAATPTPRPTLMPVSSTPGPEEYKVLVTNIGVTSYLNLRAKPSTQAEVIRILYYGQALIVTGEEGDWYAVRTDDLTGYVMKDFVRKVE
ncbi:MAG: SpoIID/LytB domain-containing protein [Clostridia bacterium]|nr:SpoIID/LytB domain-containing protein [Clostridia bacterium]